MNPSSSTVPFASTIPPDVMADMEAVAAAVAAGRKPDPELASRVRERSRKATQAVLQRCGVLNVAVDLVRQTRDEA